MRILLVPHWQYWGALVSFLGFFFFLGGVTEGQNGVFIIKSRVR